MRWTLLPFAALVLFVPSLAVAQPDLATLQQSYGTVLDQQRRASQLVVQLDQDLQQAVGTITARARGDQLRKLVSLSTRDQELFALDLAINTGLQQVYTGANALGTPEAGELLVQAALTHWTVLVRRAAMQSFHTEVEGLVDDPDCAGDVIGDELLQRYFDALFDKTAAGPARAITALTAIARQTACLGTQQSALLASNLVTSYDALMRFLRLNGLYDVGPFVAQAAAQPLLLFFDVEKHRGSRSPLTRWFIENRLTLLNAIAAGRHAALWHGLWLYDPRSGRLLGYRPTATPRDENDVDLARFYGSLASRQNLGDFSCSLSEMVERGADALGYFCAGSLCKTQQAGAAGERGRLAGGQPGGGRSPLSEEFETTMCRRPGAGGGAGDGGTGRGGSICGQGLALGGSTLAASTVRCLSQQVVQPGTQGFRCLAEATGLCSNPVDRLAKDLQDSLFAGVKPGSKCEIGKGKSHIDELPPLPQPDAVAEADKSIKAAERKAEKLDKDMEKLEKDIKTLNKEIAKAIAKRAADSALLDEKEAAKKQAEEAKKQAEADKKKAEEAKKNAEDEKKEKKREAKKNPGGKGTPACPPGTPDCGDNSCTAMADQMGRAMACAARTLNPGERDPLRTSVGGCNPTVCDPVDPTGPGPATARCLATMAPDTTVATDRQCWAVDCARQRTPTTQGCCGRTAGPAGRETGIGAPGASMCASTRCSDDSVPTAGPFGCECRERGGTPTGGFTPRPPGSFDLSRPSAFLDTNKRSRGETGLRPDGRPEP
jgi:hypothetical protein